jgi:hypothetical protein
MRPPYRLCNNPADINDPQLIRLLPLPVRKRVSVRHDDLVDRVAGLDLCQGVSRENRVGRDEVDAGGAAFDEDFGGFGERADRVDDVVLLKRIELKKRSE